MIRTLYFLMVISISLNAFAQNNLKVTAQCGHIDPSLQTFGKIELSISGGKPPYHITWNEQPLDSITRNKLYEGEYLIRISDSSGNSASLQSTIKYKQSWDRSDTSFTANEMFISCVSANRLKAGRDGEILVIVPEERTETQFGFLTDTLISNMPDHGFQLKGNRIFICSNKQVRGYFGKIKKGDTLSIARIDNKLSWSLNRKRLYSESADTAAFRVFLKHKGLRPEVLSDFSKPISVELKPVDNVCGSDPSGFILTEINGGEGPFHLRYFKGYETVPSMQTENRSLDAGVYSVILEDRTGEQVKSTVDIGFKPSFEMNGQPSVMIVDSLSAIKKISTEGWCDSKVSLKNSKRSERQWLEFRIPDTTAKCFIGLQSTGIEQGSVGVCFSEAKCFIVSIDMDGLFNKVPVETMEEGKLIRLEVHHNSFQLKNEKGSVIAEMPIVFSEAHSYSFHLFSEGLELKNIRTSNPCN